MSKNKQPFRKLRLRLRVDEITPLLQITENFAKREVRGTVDGEYPQHYAIQFTGKKINAMDDAGIMEGTFSTFICYVNGRKVTKDDGTEMYFNSIDFHEVEVEE